jgi:hypothetical protein
MAKYDPLTAHLGAVPAQEARVEMRFGDIDRLVGGLPASARTYRPWWGNSSHVQAQAWRVAGWHVQEVHLAAGRVVFARGSVGSYAAARRAVQEPGPAAGPDIEDLDEAEGASVDVAADLIALVEPMASWSPWMPFDAALRAATQNPGVYLARTGEAGPLVYVGMAGERRGRGVRGRLETYGRGKGAVSGLGEACLDRALADPEWVAERLDDLKGGTPMRAKGWARLAVERADLYLRWAPTSDPVAARALERGVLAALAGASIWNRAR